MDYDCWMSQSLPGMLPLSISPGLLGSWNGMWCRKKVMQKLFSRPLTPIHSEVLKLFLLSHVPILSWKRNALVRIQPKRFSCALWYCIKYFVARQMLIYPFRVLSYILKDSLLEWLGRMSPLDQSRNSCQSQGWKGNGNRSSSFVWLKLWTKNIFPSWPIFCRHPVWFT